MFTTVASRLAIPDPSTVAATTHRPRVLASASSPSLEGGALDAGMLVKRTHRKRFVHSVARSIISSHTALTTATRMVQLKRVREPAERSDGYRVLVERLWPRGVRKQSLPLNEWAKDIAPSTDLRKWFAHDPARWAEFQRRYRGELKTGAAAALLQALSTRAAKDTVTLLYSTHDPEHNNAVVLKAEIERRSGKHRMPTRRKSS
jgi:uncharacterized protein YeaO (DUF488 family)